MKKIAHAALLIAPLLLVACKKKDPEQVAPAEGTSAPTEVAAPPAEPKAPPADTAEQQHEQDERKAALDYGIMEDRYMNDPKAQWAETATATSSFGGKNPADSNLPKNAAGPVDGNSWTNDNQDIGFDSLEVTYAKPVAATEVRLVMPGGQGVEAISKIELQDTDGKWNAIWTGLSDVKNDKRGARTWFVRTFPQTTYKVKAVKYTIANNVQRGYKVVDAAQLVGE